METVQSFTSAAQFDEPVTDRVFTFIIDKSNGLCLAQLRSDDGTWSLTGGLVDPGETPLAALRRECFEEIGFIPSDIKEIYGSFVKDECGNKKYCRIFLATIEDARVLDFSPCPIEVAELKWVSCSDWPTPPHPEMTVLLRNPIVLSHLKNCGAAFSTEIGAPVQALTRNHH